MVKSANLYDFIDYKKFILSWISSGPQGGRGLFSKLAEAAGIHKTTFSHVLRGAKHLSLEQGLKLSGFWGMNSKDVEYLLLLIEYERAGSVQLKELFLKQIRSRQEARKEIIHRVSKSRDLTSEERAIFYSHWLFSAVRNLTAIDGFQRTSEIASKLKLETPHVTKVLDFLLSTGLCVQKPEGLRPGPAMTHIEASSPLVVRHHGNWRMKAMERHPVLDTQEELAYTAPMTLSAEDVKRVRELLLSCIEKTDAIVGPSPSERLYCMNIDWFEVR